MRGLAAVVLALHASIARPVFSQQIVDEKLEEIHVRSVYEILREVGFESVCFKEEIEKLMQENIVISIYHKGDGVVDRNGVKVNAEVSKMLAQDVAKVAKQYPKDKRVKFYALEADCEAYGSIKDRITTEYGRPAVVFLKEGDNIFEFNRVSQDKETQYYRLRVIWRNIPPAFQLEIR